MASVVELTELFRIARSRIGPGAARAWWKRQLASPASAPQRALGRTITDSRAPLRRAGDVLAVTCAVIALATMRDTQTAPQLLNSLLRASDSPLGAALRAIFGRARVDPAPWIDEQMDQVIAIARNPAGGALPDDVQVILEVAHDLMCGAIGLRPVTMASWAMSFRYAVRKGRVISEREVLERFPELTSRREAKQFLVRASQDDATLAKLLRLAPRAVHAVLRGKATPAQLNEFDRVTCGYTSPQIHPREFEPFADDESQAVAARRRFGPKADDDEHDAHSNVIELYPHKSRKDEGPTEQ